MSQLQTSLQPEVIYPDRDGQPMADNTEQFRWIVFIQQNLESLFADDPNVFVAGDLLWYPVEGDNKTRVAPDALVAFGRPKGYRGSYQQWQEGNIAPQVVFEVLSPGNTQTEMHQKLRFYDRYGVEEYYLYDPYKNNLSGWRRQDDHLEVIDPIDDWISPRLRIRFHLAEPEPQLFRPNGEPFTTLDQERQRVAQERQRAEQAEQRAARLAERLRAAGIDPDSLE
ncbi:MAG: Uma2 family endonuclease [Tildeniella nuda ZEHNDER 1965/U140]|jgi:Uma2 family endonuclease|nr:Uma2 family endonuclease [Tildeniella nuda ZEHNDER 1965/U140]